MSEPNIEAAAREAALREALEQLHDLNNPAEVLNPSMTMIASFNTAKAALANPSTLAEELIADRERLRWMCFECPEDFLFDDLDNSKDLDLVREAIDAARNKP